ncbi:MAG: aldehyde dehydrogenase family protein [Actinomycetota bacterium]
MYIGGEWVEAASGEWRPVDDPSTGEQVAEVPAAGAADTDRAVAAAREAFETGPWPRLGVDERCRLLGELGRELERRAETLTEVIVTEAGCPVRMADLMQVATPIGQIGDLLELARTVSKPVPLAPTETPPAAISEIRREPVGVCAGFSPFNFPLFMNIWKLVPAAAMGNTVVLKPSPFTPLASIELARAVEAVGFPPGVVNVVTGDVEAGERLATHPDVSLVSFTGSTAVGKRIMEMAAPTLKRLVLELGGKSPSIILDDANVELAVRGSLFSAFIHGGQACVAATRLLVHQSLYDDVLQRLRELVSAMTVGSAHDFSTDLGPVVSETQLQRITQFVDGAATDGAKVLVGGNRADVGLGGYYFEPTVLTDVTADMPAYQEEIFGPVLSVIPFEADRDAIRIANDSRYGLGAVVWSDDLMRARKIAGTLRAGTVWINDFGSINAQAPYGGYKESGLGRELGVDGMLAYTEAKHLVTALDQDVEMRPYTLIGLNW